MLKSLWPLKIKDSGRSHSPASDVEVLGLKEWSKVRTLNSQKYSEPNPASPTCEAVAEKQYTVPSTALRALINHEDQHVNILTTS